MSILKTTGIVVRSTKYGNSSKLVAFYTRDFGRVAGIARGARRVKSRFGGGLEPFIETEIIFYHRPERMLQTITDSDINEVFAPVRNDLYKSIFAHAACEMVDGLAEETSGTIYNLLSVFLHTLGDIENKKAEILFWSFQLKLFAVLGYQPALAMCMACNEPLPQTATQLSLEQGGIVCPQCRQDEGAGAISWGTIRLLEKILQIPFSEIGRYQIITTLQEEGRLFLEYYLAFHGGWKKTIVSLHSLRYLEGKEESVCSIK
jgi:DNA repair protein RecO (recombination protein O)